MFLWHKSKVAARFVRAACGGHPRKARALSCGARVRAVCARRGCAGCAKRRRWRLPVRNVERANGVRGTHIREFRQFAARQGQADVVVVGGVAVGGAQEEEGFGHALAQHALGEGHDSAVGDAEFARHLLDNELHESRRLVDELAHEGNGVGQERGGAKGHGIGGIVLIGQGGAIAEDFARPDESQGLCALGAPFAVEAHGAFQHVIKEVGNVILPVDDFVFGEDVFALGGKEARALLGGEGFAKSVRSRMKWPRILDYHLLHIFSLSERGGRLAMARRREPRWRCASGEWIGQIYAFGCRQPNISLDILGSKRSG